MIGYVHEEGIYISDIIQRLTYCTKLTPTHELIDIRDYMDLIPILPRKCKASNPSSGHYSIGMFGIALIIFPLHICVNSC